jgi:hypothetical protein
MAGAIILGRIRLSTQWQLFSLSTIAGHTSLVWDTTILTRVRARVMLDLDAIQSVSQVGTRRNQTDDESVHLQQTIGLVRECMDAAPRQRLGLVAVLHGHPPQNWHQTGTSQAQKAKKSAGANLLTLAFLGSPTWARTRDLRINSRDIRSFAGHPGVSWDCEKAM